MDANRGRGTTDRRQNQEERLRGTPKVDFETPLDYSVVRGKTALITGGASGIGLAIAKSLARSGAYVAVLDLEEPAKPGISNIEFFQTNVSSWASQLASFKAVLEARGNRLDIVVTSAGVRSNNIKDLVLDQDRHLDPVAPPSECFDVNLVGTYYTTHLALSYFSRLALEDAQERFRPQLLFLCSLGGYAEQALSADYCASKHGVRGLWKSIRAHGFAFGGCQTNLLAPTFINNRHPKDTKPRGETSLRQDIKFGEVEDVVAGAMRCICDDRVDARAICCIRGDEDAPGSNNFDLCDNILDMNGGTALQAAIRNGKLGTLGKQS